MRYMVMTYGDERSESGALPEPEMMQAIGEFMGDAAASGVLLVSEGLAPSSLGARLQIDGAGAVTVTDGPYAEAKELIAGFAILDVASREEAIEHAKRFGSIAGAHRIDVRQVMDFPG